MKDNRISRALPERAIIVKAICPTCKKEFIYNKQISRNKKYCSEKCCHKAQRDKYFKPKKERKETASKTKVCEYCGETFEGYCRVKICADCLLYFYENAITSKEREYYRRRLLARKDIPNNLILSKRGLFYKGVYYKSKAELCRVNGVSVYALGRLIRNKGYSVSQAMDELMKKTALNCKK